MNTSMNDYDSIRKKCPKMFKHYVAFECGIGWYTILDDLYQKIEKAIIEWEERNKDLSDEDKLGNCMFVDQIKEKFGTLRVYMSIATDEIYNYIEEAEAKSAVTCESCGLKGSLNNENWLKVRCEKCKGD